MNPRHADLDDNALMLAWAAGDGAAFQALYDRHERPMHRFFLRQAVAPSLALDLLQDTWMAVVRSRDGYRPQAKFTTWLYTIARSKLVDHWRATRAGVPIEDAANDDPDDDSSSSLDRFADASALDPERRAMSRQQAVAFLSAVEALPAAQRETFLLHVEGDLTLAELAEVTAVGVETAKSRLRYAMKRLRSACDDWLGAPTVEREGRR